MILKRYTIIVDADACPVKNEILQAARKFNWDVLMVASYDHMLPEMEGARVVQVDRSDQAVDLYIANCIAEGNVLITQDFGLASIGLAKKASVLSNRGQLFSDDNIDFLLARRYEHAKSRQRGKYPKGPRPLTAEDRKIFLHALTKLLNDLQENSSL